MNLPAPLPLEQEQLVIVQLVDGVAQSSVVHLPARRSNGWDRGGSTFDSYEFPPARWPSACGGVPNGFVYLQAGPLADAPMCRHCLAVSA